MLNRDKTYRFVIAFATIFFAWYGGFIMSLALERGPYVVNIAQYSIRIFWPTVALAVFLTAMGVVGIKRLMKLR